VNISENQKNFLSPVLCGASSARTEQISTTGEENERKRTQHLDQVPSGYDL